jgi:ribosome biogenesis protein Nip4
MKPELLDPIEWESIVESIDGEFGSGVTKKILGNLTPLALVEGKWRNIYLIPTSWMNLLFEEAPKGFDYHLVGKQLGVMTKDRFRLSLQILPELAQLTTRIMTVSRQGAEAFTYGRSILKESVVHLDFNLRRNQRVLVMDEDFNCLGIASLATDANRLGRMKQDDLVGKNLVDIGWFIRRLG